MNDTSKVLAQLKDCNTAWVLAMFGDLTKTPMTYSKPSKAKVYVRLLDGLPVTMLILGTGLAEFNLQSDYLGGGDFQSDKYAVHILEVMTTDSYSY